MTASTSNEDLIEEYIRFQTAAARRKAWRPATVRVRRDQLREIARKLHPADLLAATEDDLWRWHSGLAGRPETIASYTSCSRGIYKWMSAQRRPRLRDDDPTQVLERPAIPAAPPRPMLDRHYDLALACALSNPEMYIWLGLMGCSGLRCCEVAWLHVGDVELREDGSALAHLTGKGGKKRTVPIGSSIAETMKPFLRGQGPVFTRPSDGRAHTPKGVSQRTNEFLAGIGVTETAHQLRHAFGTQYHKLDVDLLRQAAVMGHSSIDMTARYTQVDPDEAAAFVEQMTRWRMRGRRDDAVGTRRGEVA